MTLSRRAWLSAAVATAFSAREPAAHAHDNGEVTPPQPAPSVTLTLDDDSASSLQSLLTGHVSAVQLMFTSCQATCPLQGALFASVAKNLGERLPAARLLSVSIDPGQDTPAALREWLKRFGPSPRWRAARPEKSQLDGLVEFLKSKKAGADPHTAQAFFFNRKSELVLRSVEFPKAAEVARILEAIAKRS